MTGGTHSLDSLEPLHGDAFGWAVACCGGDADAAADALQEAYVKVASGRAAFGGKSSLKTWWFGVVRLTALEQMRSAQRWRWRAESFLEWIALFGPEGPGGPDGSLGGAPPMEWLASALERLPSRQREVLHLVYQQQLSLSEAAGVMGVSVGSARQHYDRAKRKLRDLLAMEAVPTACDHAT